MCIGLKVTKTVVTRYGTIVFIIGASRPQGLTERRTNKPQEAKIDGNDGGLFGDEQSSLRATMRAAQAKAKVNTDPAVTADGLLYSTTK
jgi:hypothetical protein